jgi:hypothetical protein
MKIEEIKRDKCSVAVEPIASLLDEANQFLGYGVASRTERSQAVSPLRDLLAKLEIEPLNLADVVRYQAEMIAELMLDPAYQRSRIDASHEYRFFHYWSEEKLSTYSEPIPEFVLSKAIQIKKANPEVQFFVQSIEGQPDPFLIAVLGNSDDYAFIEVWEEPKFEGRLR